MVQTTEIVELTELFAKIINKNNITERILSSIFYGEFIDCNVLTE